MKNKLQNGEILEYEIIEGVNVLDGSKLKSFVCQPTMVVDQACNQEFLGQSRFLEIR